MHPAIVLPGTRQGLAQVIEEQSGVVSRAQLCAAGMPPQYGRDRVRAGAWQHLHAGVYLTHTGPTSYLARCWAALLAVDGSVLAGVTAAYLHRIRERQPSDVHVLVPYSRQAYAILPGVVVRRTRRPIQFEGSPPRTPLAATALDLVGQTRREDEVVGWITAASRRFGGLRQLREEEKNRRKLRHRELVEDLLGAGSEGLESPLEVRCDRKVLIPHGLPEFERQARGSVDGRPIRSDLRNRRYRTRIELDGRTHLDTVDDDVWRDNAVVIGHEDVTLRFRWSHVVGRPCEVARQIANALQRGGWEGTPTRCGPDCTL